MDQESCSFELILRNAGGGKPPTVENIAEFRPAPEAVEACRDWLHRHGVTAHFTGFSLACGAPKKVFETLFGVNLAGDEIAVPPGLTEWVESITLTRAPEFF